MFGRSRVLRERHTVPMSTSAASACLAGRGIRAANLRAQDASRRSRALNAGRRACQPITALLAPALQSAPAPAPSAQCPSPSLHSASKPSLAKTLWGGSQHVQAVGVTEAEELYLSLVQRTNEQHVLMVLYAPWCPHCQGIEQQVERLASGLAHERSLSVVALNCDSAAARYFSKEVLGVHAMPSFVLFPRASRTFFKYKGKGRDAESLLKFLNMVCNQSQDHTWHLGGSSSTTSAGFHAAQSLLSGVQATSLPTVLVGVAVLGLVAKLSLGGSKQVGADAQLSDEVAPNSTQHLGRQIDRILARMSGLMLRLAGARVSLQLLETQMKALGIEDAALQAAARASHPTLAHSAVAAAAVAAPAAALPEVIHAAPTEHTSVAGVAGVVEIEEAAAVPAVPAEAVAAQVAVQAADAGTTVENTAALASEASLEAQQATVEPSITAESAVSSMERSPPPEALDAAVRAALEQATSGAEAPKLTAEQVLKMLDEEGDVEKVVQKLMAQHVTPEQLPEQLK